MRTSKIALILLVSILFFAQNSFAAATLTKTDGPYITDNGFVIPTSSQAEFTIDETPFSFIQLTVLPMFKGNINMTWTWEYNGTQFTSDTETIYSPSVGSINIFHPYSNWDSVKIDRYGDWKVTTNWQSSGGSGNLINTFNLTAVPEPVSSVLFLTGGLVLALKRFRNKKVA